MEHAIPASSLGRRTEAAADAVAACVHCGFCLPTCPTYRVLGQEMDSPRGRIVLMKEVLEGKLELEAALPHIDQCLGCEACITACPSGVRYQELLLPFRAWAEEKRRRSPIDWVSRELIQRSLPAPGIFRTLAGFAHYMKPLTGILPETMASMLELAPQQLPPAVNLPALVPAQGERRARVALLTGCVQQVLAPEINLATIRVLAKNGVEVVIPPNQGCCGALSWHSGNESQAMGLASHNLEAFPKDIDAIITNAAGCGSGISEYPLIFAGHEQEARAQEFTDKTQDISVFLVNLGLVEPPSLPEPVKLAYHDACHLAHAQGVRSQPRQILGQIGNLNLLEPADWEICCGSAGTYNLEHPQIASQLGEQKLHALAVTGAQVVASGNIGCLTQLAATAARLNHPIRFLHTIEVLDRAYQGQSLLTP